MRIGVCVRTALKRWGPPGGRGDVATRPTYGPYSRGLGAEKGACNEAGAVGHTANAGARERGQGQTNKRRRGSSAEGGWGGGAPKRLKEYAGWHFLANLCGCLLRREPSTCGRWVGCPPVGLGVKEASERLWEVGGLLGYPTPGEVFFSLGEKGTAAPLLTSAASAPWG